MNTKLFSALTLPNGAIIKNRIAKAAMAESLASAEQLPNESLARLDNTFSKGGVGLIITGNVMIDSLSLGNPGDVVLQKNSNLEPFKKWAQAARTNGSHIWMQINHPGRQSLAVLGQTVWAPSEVALDMGKQSKLFAKPKAMSEDQIKNAIQKFSETALQAEKSGFTGVQIHAAHGYLISQFLSPLTNMRTDHWGGSLQNRARFLIETVKAIRLVVSPSFCVSVKINSADFQRGGFDSNDALEVIKMLNEYPVDLVELSGGSYEAPAMQGQTRDGRTLAREAYFLEFAKDILKVARMPIMTTGGIRRKEVAEKVLNEGVSIVGIATSLALNPNLPLAWSEGKQVDGLLPKINFKDKVLAGFANLVVIQRQLHRLSDGKEPLQNPSPIYTLILNQIQTKINSVRYKNWIKEKMN
jgi:2,4-dienoyl-CoA reductase-like NADH-dependent reductase (Old Yellow Enzyme family)